MYHCQTSGSFEKQSVFAFQCWSQEIVWSVDLSDQWQLELPPGLTTEAEFDPPRYYPFCYAVQQLSVTLHSAERGSLTVYTSD